VPIDVFVTELSHFNVWLLMLNVMSHVICCSEGFMKKIIQEITLQTSVE